VRRPVSRLRRQLVALLQTSAVSPTKPPRFLQIRAAR
jgi:hypothetical protein